jgi:hypothetical protein
MRSWATLANYEYKTYGRNIIKAPCLAATGSLRSVRSTCPDGFKAGFPKLSLRVPRNSLNLR